MDRKIKILDYFSSGAWESNGIPIAFIVLMILTLFFYKPEPEYGPDYSVCEEECGDSRSCFDDCVYDLGVNHKGPGSMNEF